MSRVETFGFGNYKWEKFEFPWIILLLITHRMVFKMEICDRTNLVFWFGFFSAFIWVAGCSPAKEIIEEVSVTPSIHPPKYGKNYFFLNTWDY